MGAFLNPLMTYVHFNLKIKALLPEGQLLCLSFNFFAIRFVEESCFHHRVDRGVDLAQIALACRV